jgi:8-oxo-dGTP diphosphatase
MDEVVPETALDVACALIRDERGRFLACRRAPHVRDAGAWEFPGGKVERGETPAACVIRELREELDVEAVTAPPIVSAAARVSGRRLCLYACPTTISSHPQRSTDHDRIAYMSLDDLLRLHVTEAEKALIEMLKRLS